MKHIQQSFSLRHVLIVVILVCAMRRKRIHGCDNMLYEFYNGTVKSEQDNTPNGSKMTRLYFKEYKDVQKLYREIHDWAIGLGCEITILLNKDSKPYVVVTPTTVSGMGLVE